MGLPPAAALAPSLHPGLTDAADACHDDPDLTMDGIAPTAQPEPGVAPAGTVELLVCATCRSAMSGAALLSDAPDAPRAGTQLLEALRAADLPENIRILPVECLSNCTRGCSVALRGPSRWTYVYGNLDAEMVGTLVEGATLYAASTDGLVPWRQRPEHFRKNCIARIPPLEVVNV